MRIARVASRVAVMAAVLVASACGSDSTGTDPNVVPVNCNTADPVCPPGNLQAGFSGPAGAPSITPTGLSGTTMSVSASAFSLAGSTNAASNGVWLLVTDNTLRAWGVLAVSSGGFFDQVPLFCGAQQVMLSFNNPSGRSYYRVNVTLTGCTTPQFRAQLAWDTGPSSDIDLHLLRPAGLMNSGNDCYYGNCQGVPLEWGATGAAGNPILDVDDTEGYGPENIFIVSGAEVGEYRVVVHNYDSSPSTRATVKLFFNDVEAARYTSVALDSPNNIYWEVARVRITTQQVTTVNTYSSTLLSVAGAAAAVAPPK